MFITAFQSFSNQNDLSKVELWSRFPVDTGYKLNVHKTFRRRPVSTGLLMLLDILYESLSSRDTVKKKEGF